MWEYRPPIGAVPKPSLDITSLVFNVLTAILFNYAAILCFFYELFIIKKIILYFIKKFKFIQYLC